jgi:ubiquinone/menaquinone biosynthesis C-methylase UbiE
MKKDVIAIYDEIASEYSQSFRGEKNDYIDNFVVLLPKNSRVLDAGCGDGSDTKYLIRNGFRVESVDASRGMLSIAKKSLPGHKFCLKDMRKLKYKSGSFDGIVAAFSLIHLKKNEASLMVRKFRGFLKKDGVIYIALQEGTGEKNVIEPLNPTKRIFINFYTVPEILKMLKVSKFNIIMLKTRKPGKLEFKNRKIFIIARVVK